MIKVIEYVSLLVWEIYFLLAIYRETKKTKDRDIFHMIRVDGVFFLAIYIIYNKFDHSSDVVPYLYLSIGITSLVYLLYDLIDNYKFSKIPKKDYLHYIIGFLVIILLVTYFFIWGETTKVFTITLVLNLLVPSCVSLVNWFKKN